MLQEVRVVKPIFIAIVLIFVIPLFLQAEYTCPTSSDIINLLQNGPEISIAISPVYPHNIVLMASNYVDENQTFEHVLYSNNYGAYNSWDTIADGMMPDDVVIGTHWLDPAVAIDLDNRFYVCYMDVANPQDDGYNLYINYSSDYGVSWTTKKIASNADKEHIWVDNGANSPYEGNLYTAWMSVHSDPNKIKFRRSIDGGANWEPIQVITNEEHFSPFGVNIKTGPNGEVYLVWLRLHATPENPSPCGNEIWMTKSLDGGELEEGESVSFDPPTVIIDNIKGISCNNNLGTGWPRLRSAPCLTVNPVNGQLFLVWANHGLPGENNGDADIYMISSSDGGVQWSTPVRVNPDDENHQFFPWIAIDSVTRWLHCVYYEWSGSTNDKADVYVSSSFDNGAHWTQCRVNSNDYDLDLNNLTYLTFDYIGIDSYDKHVIPAWNSRYTSAIAHVTPFNIDTENCCEGMRGDANYDGEVNIGDAVFIVNYYQHGGAVPFCWDEADVNDDGEVDMLDANYLINYIFKGGPPPVDCP